MVQSILSDDEEELSFSSYATARTDQLTGTAGTSVSTRTMVLSETSDTLVGGEEMFHTLQDVEDLAPDCLATASIPCFMVLITMASAGLAWDPTGGSTNSSLTAAT